MLELNCLEIFNSLFVTILPYKNEFFYIYFTDDTQTESERQLL